MDWFSLGTRLASLFGLRKSYLAQAASRAGAAVKPGAWSSDHAVESLQFTGWNYIAITALAKQAARADVKVFLEPGGDPDKRIPLPFTHPFVKLLTRPSPKQSGGSFRYEQVMNLRLTGVCLIWKQRNTFGRTVRRYVVPTGACHPLMPSLKFPNGGIKVVGLDPSDRVWSSSAFYRAIRGQLGLEITSEDLLVIQYPNPQRVDDGHSPTSAGSMWVDTAAMIDKARWNHLGRGPNPSMMVEPPDGVEPTQEELDAVAAKLNADYGGPENHGKIMVLSGKATALSVSPHDMEYGEGFRQMSEAILAIHGVNRAAAGLQDSMTYGSLGAAMRAFRWLAVEPVLSMLAEEEQEQQATEFGENIAVTFEASNFDDPELEQKKLDADVRAGVLTVDEYRQRRGLKPFGDIRGERIAGSSGVPTDSSP